MYNTSKALEESLKSTSEIDKLCDSVAEQMRSLRRNNQSLHQQLYKKNERIKQLESQITSLKTDKDSLKKQLDDWDSEISISDDSLLSVSGSSAASVSASVTPFKVKKNTDCKFQTPDSKNDPSEPRKKTAHKSSTTPGSDKDHAEPKEKISGKSTKKTLESKTVHRSQGDTVSEAVVNLSLAENQRAPVDHIHYVALSRLKTFDGLYITDLNTNKISISKAVKAEMQHLRECKTDLTLQFLYNMADVFRLTFLNARSLHRHLLDVKNDFNFQVAEVICFCETRFDDRDTSKSTSLNGFHQYRQDSKVDTSQNQRTPYGMALYTSEKLHIDPSSLTSDNIEIMLSEINRTEIKSSLSTYTVPQNHNKNSN